jgi:hypothetical protein
MIRYSNKIKSKYLSIVRRLGKNRSIVAIARNLLEIIYTMLRKGEDFVDNMDGLTERKIKSMQARSMNPGPVRRLEDLLDSVKKDGTKFKKKKMMGGASKELFS